MKFLLLLILLSSAKGISITCSFDEGVNWDIIGQLYNCRVIALNLSNNSTHITEVNGTHISGKSNLDVGMILFESEFCPQFNLRAIPKGFLNFFPNFIAIFFSACSIDFLNGDELAEYPNLVRYQHLESNLNRVPLNFFASTPNMTYIDFYANGIMHVGEGLLDNLSKLYRVYFEAEACIDKIAYNPSEIPSLIEALKVNCTDIVTTTSTTTNQPQRCEIDDLNDFVCGLDEEIDFLKDEMRRRNEEFENKFELLETRNEALEQEVQELKPLKGQVETLEAENREIREILLEIEQKVLDLTSRPCAC